MGVDLDRFELFTVIRPKSELYDFAMVRKKFNNLKLLKPTSHSEIRLLILAEISICII